MIFDVDLSTPLYTYRYFFFFWLFINTYMRIILKNHIVPLGEKARYNILFSFAQTSFSPEAETTTLISTMTLLLLLQQWQPTQPRWFFVQGVPIFRRTNSHFRPLTLFIASSLSSCNQTLRRDNNSSCLLSAFTFCNPALYTFQRYDRAYKFVLVRVQ